MSMHEMTDIEMRIAKLDHRVHTLEKLAQIGELVKDASLVGMEIDLVDRYGYHVSKSAAAKILCVTRATVYAMLTDGRIEGACGGKRVDVRSIARFINQRKGDAKE